MTATYHRISVPAHGWFRTGTGSLSESQLRFLGEEWAHSADTLDAGDIYPAVEIAAGDGPSDADDDLDQVYRQMSVRAYANAAAEAQQVLAGLHARTVGRNRRVTDDPAEPATCEESLIGALCVNNIRILDDWLHLRANTSGGMAAATVPVTLAIFAAIQATEAFEFEGVRRTMLARGFRAGRELAR